MNKALFLDRDGVINKEVNYLHKIEDFKFIDGIFEACIFFQKREYLLIIVTNQAGIGRGYYTEEDFQKLNNWTIEEFQSKSITIAKTYYCPYHPECGLGQYRQDSKDRKPNPGMILKAQQEFNLDLAQSILVGDKESDIQAGIAAKIGLNILVRSGHKINENITKAHAIIDSIKDLPAWFLANNPR